ncbi:transthyretin domain protein [Apiospora sp. TS-2023a]
MAEVVKDKDAITCHILDTSIGKPSQTDDDGRIKAWLPFSTDRDSGDVPTFSLDDVLSEVESTSVWTLRFDTGAYFGEGNTFFPEVVVTFSVQKGQHYHVPLLLSPYSYSTYRGS